MSITLSYEDLVELEEIANDYPEDEKDIALQVIHLAKLGYERTMEETDSSSPPEDCF